MSENVSFEAYAESRQTNWVARRGQREGFRAKRMGSRQRKRIFKGEEERDNIAAVSAVSREGVGGDAA
jgi:hypothetical protein